MEETKRSSKTIILGVGNVLLSDEGFGVHMVELLQREYRFVPDVRLIDGGTMGMELLGYFGDCDNLLLLDAIKGDKEPGHVYMFNDEDVNFYFSRNISGHEVGIQDILYIHEMQEETPMQAAVVGVQPLSLEAGCELTDTVFAALPEAVAGIEKSLRAWGIKMERISDSPEIGASLKVSVLDDTMRGPLLPNGMPVPGMNSSFPEIVL